MKPVRSRDGVILNTAALRHAQIEGEKVHCPGCGELTFQNWPYRWEIHAAQRCAGLESTGEADRKAEFKAAFPHLFSD